MTDEEWRITRAGKRYETVALAARRLGYSRLGMVSLIRRAGLQPDGHLDERTPVYLRSTIDQAKRAQPGRGARGMARKNTPTQPATS